MKSVQFTVANHGAELQSVQLGGHEFLWQGDPAYWGRRAPILFPIVGKVADDTLRIDGHEYTMKQHGFARDTVFDLCGEAGNFPDYPELPDFLAFPDFPDFPDFKACCPRSEST